MSISIIIPCFNQAQFLGEAIESARAQSVRPAEIIVVDDGSTDATRKVAQSFPGVDYVYQRNQGLSGARNVGFARSGGRYVLFLDSDDRLPIDALENGIEALRANPEAAFAYGRLRRISPHGTTLAERPEPQRDNHYRDLFAGNFIPTPGMVLFRRSALVEQGLFDPLSSATADYDLYLRMSRSRSIVGHANIAVERRIHPASMSTDPARMLRSVLRTHRKHWRLAPRDNPAFKRSYVSGHQWWQAWYGGQLVTQVQICRYRHAWKPVVKGLASLARHAPRQLPNALRPARVSRSVDLEFVSGPPASLQPVSPTSERPPAEKHLVLGEEPIGVGNVYLCDGQLQIRSVCVLDLKCRKAAVGTQLRVNEHWYGTIRANPSRLLAYLPQPELQPRGLYRLQLLG